MIPGMWTDTSEARLGRSVDQAEPSSILKKSTAKEGMIKY